MKTYVKCLKGSTHETFELSKWLIDTLEKQAAVSFQIGEYKFLADELPELFDKFKKALISSFNAEIKRRDEIVEQAVELFD